MAISTTNYNSKKMKEAIAEGRKVYGISRWPYRWINPEILSGYVLRLAPSENLLDDPSEEEWNWDDFKVKYLKQLNRSKNKVAEELKRLSEENAVLCCFEKDETTCHRSLLAEFAQQHLLNIEIKEM